MKNSDFTVTVTWSGRSWTGVCNDLGLVTEAPTVEALKRRANEIAPALYRLNIGGHQQVNLRFDIGIRQDTYTKSVGRK